MIPPASHPAWSEIIKGKSAHQFKLAAASMLVFNLRSQFQST